MALAISVAELKRRILIGWELWYCALPGTALPGRWELRKHGQGTERLYWEVIIRARRGSLPWFEKNTTEEQIGRSWCYRARQSRLV